MISAGSSRGFPWIAADKDHPCIEVIRFDSTENPAFPESEFERLRAEMPKWKFEGTGTSSSLTC